MIKSEHFQEYESLKQTVAALGKSAAEWIKQSTKERETLLKRIERLEEGMKEMLAIVEHVATEGAEITPELVEAAQGIVEKLGNLEK